MRYRSLLIVSIFGVFATAGVVAKARYTRPQLAALRDSRETHLSNVRQLTFGGQNAEAYWSNDGKKLTFQYRKDRTEADQQFVMNADGSDKRRVSTGGGRTTCGFFLKGDKELIFASTHGFSPDKLEDPDRSKGYVWSIFPYYAIYRVKLDGTDLRPLFPSKVEAGKEVFYNAEGTVSPDGRKIIFTSTKDGDLELYTMDTNGHNVKRLTHRLGYDGGAVFSPDSKMIAWRAGLPETEEAKEEYRSLLKQGLVKPSKMELWVAKADGSKPKQITKNGSANFAPFFTPDGKKLIFSSNMDDPQHRAFELYLINIDGSGLERVTYGGQFDSFPMFTRDGKKLAWASNRNGKDRETNIFTADWIP